MKAVNHSWWIGAIISTILTFVFLGDNSSSDKGILLFIGVVNGLFWGWVIGLIIDKIKGNPENKVLTPHREKEIVIQEGIYYDSLERQSRRIERQKRLALRNAEYSPKEASEISGNEESFSETDRNEIADLLEKFSRNQQALEELKQINSYEPQFYFKEFLKLFEKEVYNSTGVNLLTVGNSYKFRSFLFSFEPKIVELDKERGFLVFLSNSLGDVFKNPEGGTICSIKYNVLGVEEGKLSRWLYMHLTGRGHEPQLFLLKEDDLFPCGSLPDATYTTLFYELDRRLEKTPTQADWENLLDDFYNKI